MARKIKQFSRKDLLNKPDEFISFTEQSIKWSQNNWPVLIITVGVIAVIAVVGLLIKSSIANSKQEFQTAFTEALDTYDAPVDGEGGPPPTPGQTTYKDDKEKYQAANFRFDKLLKEHSNSKMSPFMNLYLGDSDLKMGDYDKAIQQLNAVAASTQDPDIAIIAKHNQAVAYYMQGKFDQAYPILKQLADGKSPLLKASILVYAGRTAEKLTKPDEAIKYYQLALDSYSDSQLTDGLKEKIAQLKMANSAIQPPTPAPAPVTPETPVATPETP